MDEVRQYDWGGSLEVTITDQNGNAQDVSAADSIKFAFQKPADRSVLPVSGAFSTDGKDGKVRYTFAQGDLDQVGTWRYDVTVIFAVSEYCSDTGEFRVGPILKKF